MRVRPATKDDCRAIAELALIAGAGIPEYIWGQSRQDGQEVVDVGAIKAASETGNFSYRNVHIAPVENIVAGMVLGYRLPDEENMPSPESFPELIQPLIELERCVPGSFYVNMLAVYPECRYRRIGTMLMDVVERLTVDSGSAMTIVEVFEQNEGAVRLYQRLGYEIIDQRPLVPHPCQTYEGRIFLMAKDADA